MEVPFDERLRPSSPAARPTPDPTRATALDESARGRALVAATRADVQAMTSDTAEAHAGLENARAVLKESFARRPRF